MNLRIICLSISLLIQTSYAGTLEPLCGVKNFQQTMLKIFNEQRMKQEQCGIKTVPPAGKLHLSKELSEAAAYHAIDMARNDFFEHTGSDGKEVSKRVDRTSYGEWDALGENIHFGSITPEGAVTGWMDSPGHCLNMMNPDFIDVGAACVSSDKGMYWVQVLSSPKLEDIDLGRKKTRHKKGRFS